MVYRTLSLIGSESDKGTPGVAKSNKRLKSEGYAGGSGRMQAKESRRSYMEWLDDSVNKSDGAFGRKVESIVNEHVVVLGQFDNVEVLRLIPSQRENGF